MKTKLLVGMALLAGGPLFAQSRRSIGVGIGNGGYYGAPNRRRYMIPTGIRILTRIRTYMRGRRAPVRIITAFRVPGIRQGRDATDASLLGLSAHLPELRTQLRLLWRPQLWRRPRLWEQLLWLRLLSRS